MSDPNFSKADFIEANRIASQKPIAKLRRLRLLALDLAQYNLEYNRQSEISGLLQEIQSLEKLV